MTEAPQSRHRRLIDLFGHVIDLSPVERRRFLDQMSGTEGEMREELERLLGCDSRASAVLHELSPAKRMRDVAEGALADAAARCGDRGSLSGLREDLCLPPFAGYEIERELGSGSMGRVFLARQVSTGQRVALKIIREGFYSPKILRRFEFEVEALGRLDHPGIARIFDAGTGDSDGGKRPYFAMEYLRGETLLDFARHRKLDLKEKVELLASICEAVHHAHQQRVIHRDLKPDNILVTEDGRPKVLDFGVARIVDADVQLTTIGPDIGQLIGTLRYMSPEQAAGDTPKLDTRSDVYALGVVAFELIAGRAPYDLDESSLLKAVRVIQEQEPRRLGGRKISIPSDVETIVAKALEKDKGRRYSSAAEFAEDLRRYLRHEPIAARPASALYQIRKYALRHRAVAGALLSVLLISIVGMAVSLHYAAGALRANELAQWQVYVSRLLAASAEMQDNGLRAAQEFLEEAPPQHRAWEWRYLSRRTDQSLLVFDHHADYAWSVAVSPDGSRVFVGEGRTQGGGARVRVWDLETGSEERVLPIHLHRVRALACSLDGSRVASGSRDETIRLLDGVTLETVAVLEGNHAGITSLAFSPTDGPLASGAKDGALRLWDAHDGSSSRSLAGHGEEVFDLSFSPQGDLLASASADGTIKIWEVATGEKRGSLDLKDGAVIGVSFSADGTRLAAGTRLGTVQIWDVASRQRLKLIPPADPELVPMHSIDWGIIGSVAYSPDGCYLASAAGNDQVLIWDADDLDSDPLRLVGHTAPVCGLTWTRDSRRLLSTSWDNSVRAWDAQRFEDRVVPDVRDDVQFFGFGSDPDSFLTLDDQGSVRIEEARSGVVRSRLFSIPDYEIRNRTFFGPNVETLATSWLKLPDTHFGAFDLHSGDELFRGRGGQVMAFSADGETLAVETAESEIVLYSLPSGEEKMVLPGAHNDGRSMAFSPDGTLLARGGLDNIALVWDLRSGEQIATLRSHDNSVLHVVFNATGTKLATSGVDGTTRVWDTSTFEELASFPGTGVATGAAFHPTEPRLATLANDGSVRIWSLDTYEKLIRIHEGDSSFNHLRFSPDGNLLVLCSYQNQKMVVLDGS